MGKKDWKQRIVSVFLTLAVLITTWLNGIPAVVQAATAATLSVVDSLNVNFAYGFH